ncbi:PAS/PAC sensor hybrid histidine kinase [Candidatus Magnetoovum chiemensis]|nr:PAS/PAC sensor hybrid histidine kinase [Candidatus Magnetoovum chiemensis]
MDKIDNRSEDLIGHSGGQKVWGETASPPENMDALLVEELDEMLDETFEAFSPERIRKKIHELRVNKIGLEMKNEELRWIQGEIDAARSRYFDLYDLAPVGYCTISGKGIIIEANLTATVMLGLARDGLVSQRLSRFIFKEDQDIYYQHRKHFLKTGKLDACELRMLKQDGTTLWAHLEVNSVQAEEKCPVRRRGAAAVPCRVVLTDITERRKAEELLMFKTMLLEAQSETSMEGILAVDNEGHSIIFNRRFGQIWKIPQYVLDTLDDRTMLEFILKQLKYPEEFIRKVEYLYEHKYEKSRDEIVFVDGRCFDRYTSPLIDFDGKHHGRIWYFRDITERKEIEEEIYRTRGIAEAATLNKSKFLSSIAHEIRTPINAVINMTRLLLDTKLDQEQKDYTETAMIASGILLSLVNDVLDFSKIET